jgi:hypothetical protein
LKEAEVEIRLLEPEETDLAAGLIGRAFRNLPTCVAVYGRDEFWRARFLDRSYRRFLRTMPELPLSAWRGGELLGVCGVQHPGNCRVSIRQKLRMTPLYLRSLRLRVMLRSIEVFDKRDAHDLDEPHLHLEPLAVEPAAKSDFIGLLLLQAACDEADRLNLPTFGITESRQNVAFFEGFGGKVVEEFENVGVPNWALLRAPRAPTDLQSLQSLARPEGADGGSGGTEAGGTGPRGGVVA